MKKITLLLFCLIFIHQLFSQQGAIKITNETTKKEVFIKENKIIKIKTTEGQKISGHYTIADENAIMINNVRIPLANIDQINRQPFLISFITAGVFVYIATITVATSVLVGLFADSSALLYVIPGAAILYAGIKPPNLSKSYTVTRNWSFELLNTYQKAQKNP